MAQINPPKPNPLIEWMAKLLREKAPGVVEAAGKVAEYPPVKLTGNLMNAGDPMGVMGMGMATVPKAASKALRAIKPGEDVGRTSRASKYFSEAAAGGLVDDFGNPMHPNTAKALKEHPFVESLPPTMEQIAAAKQKWVDAGYPVGFTPIDNPRAVSVEAAKALAAAAMEKM